LLVFNDTFSNISAISWRPVLVVEEAGVPGENHRPWASNSYILKTFIVYFMCSYMTFQSIFVWYSFNFGPTFYLFFQEVTIFLICCFRNPSQRFEVKTDITILSSKGNLLSPWLSYTSTIWFDLLVSFATNFHPMNSFSFLFYNWIHN
jgi:hypothetical protein